MEEFTRHCVSQKLGRLAIRVHAARADTGTVEVIREGKSSVHFQGAISIAQQLCARFTSWQEWAARVAIAQMYKVVNTDFELHLGPISLDITIHPWAGDLLADPYGGATIGIHLQIEERLRQVRAANGNLPERIEKLFRIRAGTTTHDEKRPHGGSKTRMTRTSTEQRHDPQVNRRDPAAVDRRIDNASSEAVQRGLDLVRAAGDTAAIAYLLGNRIPQCVVLRVLACAAFRRNTARYTRRAACHEN